MCTEFIELHVHVHRELCIYITVFICTQSSQSYMFMYTEFCVDVHRVHRVTVYIDTVYITLCSCTQSSVFSYVHSRSIMAPAHANEQYKYISMLNVCAIHLNQQYKYIGPVLTKDMQTLPAPPSLSFNPTAMKDAQLSITIFFFNFF